jgi:DNA polymerase (family 10)
VLEQIAGFLEFRGENQFRVRAFRNAAKTVMGLPKPAAEALADGTLAATRGIGPATLAIIKEVLATERSEYLEELKQETPPGLLELLGIPGLGAARLRLLHEQLKIASLDGLEAAARDGSLARVPGFGVKTAEKLLTGIAFARKTQPLRLSHEAAAEAEVLRSALERLPGVTRALVAGEVRRACEVAHALALVAVSEEPAERLGQALAASGGVEELTDSGEGLLTFRSPGGMAASVRVTTRASLGAVLVHATGSTAHLAQLTAHAEGKGYMLGPGALHRADRVVAAPDEATLYRSLGLAEIPPELREGSDEISRAAEGTLPCLIELGDLRGMLHCHTTYSDGTLGVAEMALASREAGYAYLGISDHSRTAAYAGGLSVDEVRRQWDEIDTLNRTAGIRILKGIESDILVDGQLDYDEVTLAGFDFVIGSIHSRFSLSPAEMTARVLRALDNPYLTILGHPTGRRLLARDPYRIDLEQVFARAAANGVALEINGDPHRLDLDWRMLRRAREQGVVIAVGADAHSRAGIAYLASGVAIARKGGLEQQDVLNTRPVEQFLDFARARRA